MVGDLFQNSLVQWYQRNKRDLPWRRSKDPYRIWLSEVILQQTRVEQGMPYYLKFIENYPRVQDLAKASEDSVLKDWEGLGYYSRARNLHAAAKQITNEFQSQFPDNYESLLRLKGIGDYTASAISSIVFDEPQAVVDGNVYRVLSRFFGIDEPINTSKGIKVFKSKAQEVLLKKDPGTFNQALMEFGALQCVPRNPDCESCILREGCQAFSENRVGELPIKLKKKYDRIRHLNYSLFIYRDKVYIEKRVNPGIWHNLYQFHLLETTVAIDTDNLFTSLSEELKFEGKLRATHVLKPHKLSHQSLHITLSEIEIDHSPEFLNTIQGRWVNSNQLKTYAFPRPLRAILDRNQLTLPLD